MRIRDKFFTIKGPCGSVANPVNFFRYDKPSKLDINTFLHLTSILPSERGKGCGLNGLTFFFGQLSFSLQ
jgi:hypothetical protein